MSCSVFLALFFSSIILAWFSCTVASWWSIGIIDFGMYLDMISSTKVIRLPLALKTQDSSWYSF